MIVVKLINFHLFELMESQQISQLITKKSSFQKRTVQSHKPTKIVLIGMTALNVVSLAHILRMDKNCQKK